jgi:hypothetical protein
MKQAAILFVEDEALIRTMLVDMVEHLESLTPCCQASS